MNLKWRWETFAIAYNKVNQIHTFNYDVIPVMFTNNGTRMNDEYIVNFCGGIHMSRTVGTLFAPAPVNQAIFVDQSVAGSLAEFTLPEQYFQTMWAFRKRSWKSQQIGECVFLRKVYDDEQTE